MLRSKLVGIYLVWFVIIVLIGMTYVYVIWSMTGGDNIEERRV